MTRARALISTALTLACLTAVLPAAAAEEVIDQQATWNPIAVNAWDAAYVTDSFSVSQAFTAVQSGFLTKVEIDISPDNVNSQEDLIVAIYPTAEINPASGPNYIPAASDDPLATTTVAGDSLNFESYGQRWPEPDRRAERVAATFATPAQVSAGSTYAIVVSTITGGNYVWFAADTGPYVAAQGFAGTFTPWNLRLVYNTYVDRNWQSSVPAAERGASTSSAASTSTSQTWASTSTSQTWALRLEENRGPLSAAAILEVESGWLQLPTPVLDERSESGFLGWSTSPAFPVDVARKHTTEGLGAVDDYFDGERMIFIPAGGFTLVSGSTRLFAIWDSLLPQPQP